MPVFIRPSSASRTFTVHHRLISIRDRKMVGPASSGPHLHIGRTSADPPPSPPSSRLKPKRGERPASKAHGIAGLLVSPRACRVQSRRLIAGITTGRGVACHGPCLISIREFSPPRLYRFHPPVVIQGDRHRRPYTVEMNRTDWSLFSPLGHVGVDHVSICPILPYRTAPDRCPSAMA